MSNSMAYQQSITLLKKASLPQGFVAAVHEHDNYKRVWTRDGVVCSLAALLSEEEQLLNTTKATIQTIFNHIHNDGFVPSNVNPKNGSVSYGGAVGRADNPSWAIIGLCCYTLKTNDYALAEKYLPQVKQCFTLLTAWEFNGKHLIYVPQSGDWADEYIQHGYILFEQLLRIWALELAAKVYKNNSWKEKAAIIKEVVQNNFWITPSSKPYLVNLFEKQKEAFNNYWLMGFNPARVYRYFDLQANGLALLLQIGTTEQNQILIQKIKSTFFANSDSMIPSFYPAITEKEDDMKELLNNYAYNFRNKPHQFHNGGLWPVWNGLMAMALAKNGENVLAEKITTAIHLANQKDNHSFNECFDGISQETCGVANCAWSAAGAILAEQSLSANFLITSF